MQLQQQKEELESLGIRVAVVTFETEAAVRAYASDLNLGWPLLMDASRALYRAYGMERGHWWNIYGPASLWAYFNLTLKGRRLQRPTGDPNQLGGDVLIDPDGIVRLHHVGVGPADRPETAQLLALVRQLQA